MTSPRARPRRRGGAGGGILAVALACATACSGSDRPPSVVLITLDTLRADHLGCYGYARDTSPGIDTFASAADLHTNAIAAAPWTVPTHASIFTGRFPFEHGAHTLSADPREHINALPEHHTTLAEMFSSEGYATAAFTANVGYLSRRWQLDQGFDDYTAIYTYAENVNRMALRWLDDHMSREGDRPFFLFVNFMDTHRPYNTAERPGLLDGPVQQDRVGPLDQLIRQVMVHGRRPPGLVRTVIDQYDTAIANVDAQVAALLDALRVRGAYEDALIVLTSDHGEYFGEYFGEHDLVEHAKDVYEAALRVPLIIKAPQRSRPRVVDELTSSVDIAGLMLDRLPEGFSARHGPSFSYRPGSHPVLAENYYSRGPDLAHPVCGSRFRRVRTALYTAGFKLIRTSDGRHELYELSTDPEETRDLAAIRPDRVASLTRRLADFEGSRRSETQRIEQAPLGEREREQLRELGYAL